MTIIGQLEPAGMAKHVWVDREWHLGGLAEAPNELVETDRPLLPVLAQIEHRRSGPARWPAAQTAHTCRFVRPAVQFQWHGDRPDAGANWTSQLREAMPGSPSHCEDLGKANAMCEQVRDLPGACQIPKPEQAALRVE